MSKTVQTLHETIINPTGPGNPRNGEGDIVSLPDGRLLMGYTRFTGGGHDHSAADIYGRWSADGGLTWGEPFVLQPNVGACNVMCVSLKLLQSGDLLFAFGVKDDEYASARHRVRRSADGGQTWSDMTLAIPEEGYFVINNGYMLQTSSGRVILPVAKAINREYHCVASCFFSDDDGRTWRRTADYLDVDGRVGLQETGIVECGDGSLWMWARTDKGVLYQSRSTDMGESWSTPEPTELVHPISPATAARLPDSDAILMVYNDRRGVPHSPEWHSEFNHRTPLSAAVSHDHARTWQHDQLVEADRSQSYCYTSITFHKDTTLLTYYVGKAGGPNLLDMKLKIVPTAAWTE